ncbi:hypothetical protein FPSE_03724 [Fusarium pseudograminearum CS3096]|uniref:Uncharacterized protein n=1 Tax=Fusarium pseudograminearum (strain CS3096) TaxID=1028729 RepID=K3VM40_FUSPC|nr:hypothetical protein FPSE_03724 [Fusarium pseudograminearum CS3096]EKJ76092.1 hypothetical protein FPSE_03724 [Fusarium pseudograminearum CS3096]
MPSDRKPKVRAKDVLEEWYYDLDPLANDCAKIAESQYRAGYEIRRGLISTIKSDSQFRSCLERNKSSRLLIDIRPENPAGSLELPIVALDTYRELESLEGSHGTGRVIQLVFFASQHKDVTRDRHMDPSDLALSLLSQLVYHYRHFDADDLRRAKKRIDPRDISSILLEFERLLIRLPRNTTVIIIIDDLDAFAHPSSRERRMMHTIGRLLEIHGDRQYEAKLKFIFGNSSRNIFSYDLFKERDTLRIRSSSRR